MTSARSEAGRQLARARWGAPKKQDPEADDMSSPCACPTCVADGCNDPAAADKPPHQFGPMRYRPYRHWHQDVPGPGRGGAHIIEVA